MDDGVGRRPGIGHARALRSAVVTEAYELATAALRQDPGRDLESLGIDRLPLPERLMVRAFALGLDDYPHAACLFHEALARDPYHPGGRYDLACVLATAGDRRGAAVTVLDAIRDGGDKRLATRAAADPDLAGLDLPADQLARAVSGGSHCLSAFQVRCASTRGSAPLPRGTPARTAPARPRRPAAGGGGRRRVRLTRAGVARVGR